MDQESTEDFIRKNRFLYSVLMDNVKTVTGSEIVRKYYNTLDGRGAYFELAEHHTTSPSAEIVNQRRLTDLQQANIKNHRGPYVEFITDLLQSARDYNDLVTIQGL